MYKNHVRLTTSFGALDLRTTVEGNRELVSNLERADDDPNPALDAIESLVLGHYSAGIDVSSEAYQAGVNAALEAVDNNS